MLRVPIVPGSVAQHCITSDRGGHDGQPKVLTVSLVEAGKGATTSLLGAF